MYKSLNGALGALALATASLMMAAPTVAAGVRTDVRVGEQCAGESVGFIHRCTHSCRFGMPCTYQSESVRTAEGDVRQKVPTRA
jgi:hypothetical protein